jgi:hypothetical protein
MHRCHRVIGVRSYPQYNLNDEFRNKNFDEFSDENDIDVIRIKTLPHLLFLSWT